MKVRINNNTPNASQRKALRKECVKEFDKLLAEYNREVALQVLYILRFEFGFGQKRLERFADLLSDMQIKQRERYELGEEDTPWLCANQLAESGIDVSAMLGDNYETEVI